MWIKCDISVPCPYQLAMAMIMIVMMVVVMSPRVGSQVELDDLVAKASSPSNEIISL